MLQATKYRVSELTISFVEFGLNEKWSPEQIAGVGKIIGYDVSHEWIYGYVERVQLHGGKLYKQLRQSHRRYRKGNRAKRVIIPNRVGIEHRPAIVNQKKRFGDWESVTVLSKQVTGAIVSLVERKSKLYLIRKVQLMWPKPWLVCCGNIALMSGLSLRTTAANSVTMSWLQRS